MKGKYEYITDLYLSGEYIKKHPSLHEQDSHWKVSKIIPFVDRFIDNINKDEINLLDVGGGTGLILKLVSNYIEEAYKIKVNKFSLDLSPEMLELQKKRNLNLKRALKEDIRKTSLGDKEIDLTLMIDVLEHVPNPIEALKELKRISKFVIFKVPLDDTLSVRIYDFIKRGEPRKNLIEDIGHINFYNFIKLKHQIIKNLGKILDFSFTNTFDYYLNSEYYKKRNTMPAKLKNFGGNYLFRLSPKLCSLIFPDFVMIIVKC